MYTVEGLKWNCLLHLAWPVDKFVSTEGKLTVYVCVSLHQAGRIPPDHPLVGGHKGPVLDIAWDPFNDNVIASGSEDCVVKVWQIPDYGLVT